MSVVTGKNINIYVSGGTDNSLYLIGCEETCTITINTEVINTTTRGSGRARGREYGLYDVTVQSNGVMFVNAFATPDSQADPMFFGSSILEGKKCVVKYQVTDGTNTRYYIGSFVVQTAVYTGSATGFGTYDVTLINDGELYKTDDLKINTEPSTFIFESTSTVDGFTNSALINVDIFYIYRYGVTRTQLFESIQVLSLSTDMPTGTNTVGYHAASGTLNFENALANLDFIVVGYI
jgi:predicted secreted protein